MSEAKRIKEYYIRPPIKIIETDWQKRRDGCQFEINTKIWVDQYLPEYRVAIPEHLRFHQDVRPSHPIEYRFITYVPTGRTVYDNTKPHPEAVAYEYILESLLGKKEMKGLGGE